MGFLFAVIAGNFVSDYMKDSYEVIHHDWALGNLAIMIGGAIFVMKQISDCFLYYQDFSHYEPETSVVSKADYAWFFFDNCVEFAILLFAFGGIYEFKNVDANRQVTTHALARFLSAASLTELCWLIWDLSFIFRSIRHQPESKLFGRLQSLAKVTDPMIVATWRWTVLNLLWFVTFGVFWSSVQFDPPAVQPPEAFEFFGLLTFYAFSFAILLRNYYSGSMYPPQSSLIVVPFRSQRETVETYRYWPRLIKQSRNAEFFSGRFKGKRLRLGQKRVRA